MSAKRQADAAELSPMIDFRAQDDAWYSVRLRLDDEKLFVMYCDFPQESDELYSVERFTNIESLDEFGKRFRSASSQLQDKNCDVVVKGMMVCAATRLSVDDLRFFDAIVESINPSIHALQEGECRCKFELLWQHGPLKGKKAILGIEDVCLINSRATVVNWTLEKFVDIVKEKLKAKDNRRSSKENMIDNLEHDFDMGGQSLRKHQHFEKKRTYFCRIDNLEKDLSPFTLKNFVQEHLGIPCLAFICPSISHEFCTRGFILLEEKSKANKLMDFLLNGEYIIVSLKGRPWIIDEACFGIAEGVMPTYEVKQSNTREELAVQIKLVHKGTAEYEKMDKVRLLHSEFLEHIHFRLLPRLLADERKLMKQLADEKSANSHEKVIQS